MRLRIVAVSIAATWIALAIVAWPYVRVASFVVRAAGVGGWLDEGARAVTVSTVESPETIPTRYGPIRARLYRPSTAPSRTVLLVTGTHPGGIDEPRLMALAREVAASGWAILTPELAELMTYRITPRSTDLIEDAGVWLSERRDLVPDGRIGMMGISFSGGLAVVAAGRDALRRRVRFVFSFGGYGNLPRVLKYFCTGIEPEIDGELHTRPPHDYGLAIVAYNVADQIVPAEQVDAFQDAVITFLKASNLAVVDPHAAEAVFARARIMENTLAEPSRTLAHYVNERNVSQLGSHLLPHVATFGNDPSLSPDRSTPPDAPVFLLHGVEDNVIPAIESRLLARWLAGKTPVRMFLSNPITHVNVTGQATFADYWGLISFWRELLAV